MKTQPITTTELITAEGKQKGNTTMNNTINAQFISIHLPAQLQQKYTNHQLYIQLPENIIRKSPDYIKDPHSQTRSYRFDHNHNIIYKESNLIQIIWLDLTNQHYFITNYKPKETTTETINIPGSYGSAFTQSYSYTKDYLREYLLKQLSTQVHLDLSKSNKALLEIIIKEKENYTYQFKRTTETNGDYTNLRYYPIHIKEDKLKEDQ